VTFDEEKANRAIRFIELLKHTGDFNGVPFQLLPWERKIIWDVYGTMNERRVRQYRYVYLELPKKNGKSELAAAVSCLHLFDRTETNGQIFGCAGDRSQASLVFNGAIEMIDQDPVLTKRVKINESYKRIINKETGTFYQVVSAEAYTKHGLNVSGCIFDELHVQPNRNLWDVMTKGAGLSRRQPIWWVITTAGDDPDRVSIGWEIHEKAEKILIARQGGEARKDNPTWYPVIYSYQGDDIYNEKNWARANPSLGVSIQVPDLRDLALDAQITPADERTFRWLNLNQWITTKLSSWLPIDLFDATIGEWTRDELAGKTCYLGLDLSSTTDLSALCALFPPQKGFDDWRAIWECWIPEDNMRERIRVDHVPYDLWVEGGWITATEGPQIDYTVIEEKIQEYRKLYKVRELDMDKHFATMLSQRLEQDRLKCVDIDQGYNIMTDPIQMVEVLLGAKKQGNEPLTDLEALSRPGEKSKRRENMTHEASPVARWCFGNTSISKNGNGQIKFVKEHKGKSLDRTKRIDLTVALVIAMARAKFYKKAGGVYDRRGVRMVGGGKTTTTTETTTEATGGQI
jgi:phage terminase large subunit-like protein